MTGATKSRPMGGRRGSAARTTARWCGWIAALAWLTGCPRPLLVARPYAAPTAAVLGEALTARQGLMGRMNARVRATSWLGGDRVRATVLMLVDRPGRLRFEAEVSLQGTVAVLATDGQTFAFLDTTKNELRRGPACPANVAALIRIPLDPADVAAILLGDVRLPPDAVAAAGEVDWDPAQAADVLVVRSAAGWMRVLFQGWGAAAAPGASPQVDPLRVVGASAIGPDGRPRWRVEFADFVDTTAGTEVNPRRLSLPQTIRFAEGGASFDDGVEIKFKERTVNETTAPDAFSLRATPGTVTIPVGCPPTPAPPAR